MRVPLQFRVGVSECIFLMICDVFLFWVVRWEGALSGWWVGGWVFAKNYFAKFLQIFFQMIRFFFHSFIINGIDEYHGTHQTSNFCAYGVAYQTAELDTGFLYQTMSNCKSKLFYQNLEFNWVKYLDSMRGFIPLIIEWKWINGSSFLYVP